MRRSLYRRFHVVPLLSAFLTLSFAEFPRSAALDDDIFGHESIDGIGSCAFQTSSQYAPTISVDRMFSRCHEDGGSAGLSIRTGERCRE